MDHKSTMRPAAVGQSGQPRLIRPVFARQFNLSRARILWGSLIRIVALSPIVLAGACASIVSDNDSTTYIATEPQNARCELQGNKFKRVVDTPANISLPADAAPISVICEAEGFRQTSKDMDTSADGWIVGNILFGGIVGIAIDAARGAGQKYPEEFTVVLEPGSFESLGARDAWYDARRQEINEEWDEVTRTIDNECNRNMKELCTKKKADAEKVRAQELEALEQRRKTAVVSIPDGNSNPQALNGSQSTTKEMTRMEVPLGEPGAEQVAKATPEGREDLDCRWVIEIADASDESRTDTRTIEIKDGRFSVEVSFYGWRGAVAGQIDGSGNLTGKVNLKKMGYGRRIDPFEASYREGEFHAKTVSKSRSGGVYKGAAAFMIDLTRATASSEVECISTECEAKDEQATGSSWPCLKWVNLRHSPAVPPTSGVGGRADEIGTKPDIGQRMSPVGG